jgi:hypothetical protein
VLKNYDILAITLSLSIQLQSTNIDYSKAIAVVYTVKSALNRTRENPENYNYG